jgi:uncharacterized membrane protein
MKQIAIFIAGTFLVAALITGGIALDFHMWRLEHPSTPTWVYWVRSGK